ncbi:hypothetical protein NLX71_12895 [Paenibacillus sp. MZ04-78.2]|uniref:hypothetical protein n=1 Tax=Paenibacillus sp. MZ04-78.2 TaxID=2962034 RepID=UPI0020B901B0|nr:hypothetical protein [Paenibacillus sp. MZ04-78.2]MCP3774201.1 hypothetical protein [Paenibacillus sp. MZ04-78.2]
MIHHTLAIEAVIIAIVIVTMWYAVSNFISIKRVIIGRPMRLKELHAQHNKLFWIMAMPILSADLYSSVSYGPESGITELAGLGPDAKRSGESFAPCCLRFPNISACWRNGKDIRVVFI